MTRRGSITLLLFVGCLTVGCRDRARGVAPKSTRPTRVVSTTVASDEILLDLIGGDRLVAVTRFGVKPSWSVAAGRLQKIKGRIHTVSGEAVLEHRPRLAVLADYSRAETRLVLNRAGVRVVQLRQVSGLRDIRHNIRTLGKAVGEPKRADRMLAHLDRILASYKKATDKLSKRPEVMSATRGFLAGKGTIFHDVVNLAGGQNVADRLGRSGHGRVDTEAIWKANPAYVLLEAPDRQAALKAARADPVLSKLKAVTEGRVLYLPRALLSCASHHVTRAVWTLLGQLHPHVAAKLKPPAPLRLDP
jgi:iron complex transport system substrate-binding protein